MNDYIAKLVREMKEEGTWASPEELEREKQEHLLRLGAGLEELFFLKSIEEVKNQKRLEWQKLEWEKLEKSKKLYTFPTGIEAEKFITQLKKANEAARDHAKRQLEKSNKRVHDSVESFVQEAGEHVAQIIDRSSPVEYEWLRFQTDGRHALKIKFAPRPRFKILVFISNKALTREFQIGYADTVGQMHARLIDQIEAHARTLNKRRQG